MAIKVIEVKPTANPDWEQVNFEKVYDEFEQIAKGDSKPPRVYVPFATGSHGFKIGQVIPNRTVIVDRSDLPFYVGQEALKDQHGNEYYLQSKLEKCKD